MGDKLRQDEQRIGPDEAIRLRAQDAEPAADTEGHSSRVRWAKDKAPDETQEPAGDSEGHTVRVRFATDKAPDEPRNPAADTEGHSVRVRYAKDTAPGEPGMQPEGAIKYRASEGGSDSPRAEDTEGHTLRGKFAKERAPDEPPGEHTPSPDGSARVKF